jgi:ribose 1,5-bisphosphokinase
MGPSGAGKDTVLRLARGALAPGEKIAFAHRYITRPADPRHENYVALSAVEFETRHVAGLFAFDWQAYGFRYGVGIEIEAWRQARFVVVVSGSREHFRTLRPRPNYLIPVLITAPPEILAQRLAGRAREDVAARGQRLLRAELFALADPAVVALDNSGPPDQAGAALLELMRRAANAPSNAPP